MNQIPSVTQLREGLAIREQIEQLSARLTALFNDAAPARGMRRNGAPAKRTAAKQTSAKGGARAWSPAARKRQSEVMRARWALLKKTDAAPAS